MADRHARTGRDQIDRFDNTSYAFLSNFYASPVQIRANRHGLALIDASWLCLGLAIVLVVGLASLILWGRRNRRRLPVAKPGLETRPVIRHVPLTRRNAV